MNTQKKTQQRERRHARIRSKIAGTSAVPRLAVFRSNAYIYAQLIDDEQGITLVSVSDLKVTSGTKKERARQVGKEIAEKAKAKKITQAVFDRGGFMYTGRVQALADGAREAGLQF